MKRWGIIGLSTMLLAGCSIFGGNDDGEQDVPEVEITDDSLSVIPPVASEENHYSSVLKDGAYLHGETRGYGVNTMNRSNLDWFELGLEEIAKDTFEPGSYYFQEGQHLTRGTVVNWINRYSETNPDGLNPELRVDDEEVDLQESIDARKQDPLILRNILEHNYMQPSENGTYETEGIVIGLALYSVYSFTYGGTPDSQEISANQQEQAGREAAEKIVERLRDGASALEEDISDVPIVVALFDDKPSNDLNAGNFFMKGVFEPGQGGEWTDINETHIHFPSSDANNDYQYDADRFSKFQSDIQGFFENHVGVVGKARYEENRLAKLAVTINIQYKGKAEVVALTQFAASKAEEYFEEVPVDIEISSMSGVIEGIVSYYPDRDPFIYVTN
ncbi:CamS family sex pheromone protein [Shouchella miscanthi]|uniref:CamS family sex pheromone protein n=1 Tax=Shouchella miscanthi TaxID=2598861 RepID=A0ABU6NLN7_9BACI|nr:CamS family sex pheromone protein [Shouchella miscanthi]